MATSDEIAQALAVACLNQPEFIANSLIPPDTRRGNAELAGKKVGEFYQAIHKAVEEASSKAADPSES